MAPLRARTDTMAQAQSRALLRHLWHLADGGPAASLPDRQLLERFAARQDEAAFTALLRRYGPLVWGLCRRLLPREQDAEDAFQATFLTLARKAPSIRKPDSLGPWLYGVASHVAAQVRRAPVHHPIDADVIPA